MGLYVSAISVRAILSCHSESNDLQGYELPASNIHIYTHATMVKPLTFKGDKKSKKRKRTADIAEKFGDAEGSTGDGQAVSKKAEGDPAVEDDDSWVTAEAMGDIMGPVVFVLPSDPPTCLACDASGKVFASSLENIIDGDPSTAEPHDVRQVWVASRVAGTESFSFKGHHAK